MTSAKLLEICLKKRQILQETAVFFPEVDGVAYPGSILALQDRCEISSIQHTKNAIIILGGSVSNSHPITTDAEHLDKSI